MLFFFTLYLSTNPEKKCITNDKTNGSTEVCLMVHVKHHVLQMPSYLAGPEDDPIIILWSLLPLLQFLSPNANCHWAQVLINTKVVLVFFKE